MHSLLFNMIEKLIKLLFGEMLKEIIHTLSLLKQEGNLEQKMENQKHVEALASLFLYCFDCLIDNDISFLNEFLQKDFIFLILKVSLILFTKRLTSIYRCRIWKKALFFH